MFKLTPIASILFITTAINIAVSYTCWQRRRSKGGMYFALGMMAVSLWTLAAGAGYSAVSLNLKIIFAKIDAIGYNVALPFFILFAVYHASLEEWRNKKWLHALLIMIPISNILLIATNELHGWVWTGFSPVQGNVVVFEHGPGFVWVASTGYLMIVSLLIILWLASRKGSEISRRQSRVLLYAGLFPIIANIFYLYGIKGTEGVDWSSVTFSLTGLLFLHALYTTRLLDLVPIARDKLFSSVSDGMVVLDMQNRIIDINNAAASMIASTPALLLGKDFTGVTPLAQSFLEGSPEQEIKTELEVSNPNQRYFDVLISPLREEPNKIFGRLITFRDVTERKENELRLLQLTQAVEQSPSSVIITDTKGIIKYVNPQFNILTGYTTNEVLGKTPNIIQSGKTNVEMYRGMWQTIQSGKTWRGELQNRKKNGDLYWEYEVIAPVVDNDGHIINFIAFKEDITKRKQAEEALELRVFEIQELNDNLIKTQAQIVEQQRDLAKDEERQRMARDLHDSLSQSIHSLGLFSETLAAAIDRKDFERARRVLERVRESAQQAHKETRLLLYELQNPNVERVTDLIQALKERLEKVELHAGVKAQLIQEGSLEYCPQKWHEELFWMTIETLNNALKHAFARKVQVHLRCSPQHVELEVSDDGKGFNVGEVYTGGMGLDNLRARASLIGGTLTIESQPEKGTTVFFRADIPITT